MVDGDSSAIDVGIDGRRSVAVAHRYAVARNIAGQLLLLSGRVVTDRLLLLMTTLRLSLCIITKRTFAGL